MRKTQPIAEKTAGQKPSRPLINHRDQGTLLRLVTCGLAMTVCYWWYYDSQRGGLIEIDRATPLQAHYQVDINRADWPEIIQLPGLGEALAGRIISNRTDNGPFRDLDDIVRVKGIGPRTLERIRPYLLPIAKDTDWAALENQDEGAIQ